MKGHMRDTTLESLKNNSWYNSYDDSFHIETKEQALKELDHCDILKDGKYIKYNKIINDRFSTDQHLLEAGEIITGKEMVIKTYYANGYSNRHGSKSYLKIKEIV